MAPTRTEDAVPGPPPRRVLGWTGNLIQFFRDPIVYLQRLQREYGNVAAFVRGNHKNIFNRDVPVMGGSYFGFGPECNHQIMTRREVYQTRPVTVEGQPELSRMSAGLMAFNGPLHKQRRRIIMPAFHKQHIANYRDEMIAAVEAMLSTWRVGEERNILHDMQLMTLDVANRCLFGLDSTDEATNIGKMGWQWLRRVITLGTLIRLNIPGTPYWRLVRLSKALDRAIRTVLDAKRPHAHEQKDVLATLIAAHDENGDKLGDDELVGHANVLFIASHETTANALTWTLFLLAQHPEIAADLLDELDGVLGGNPPTVEQIKRLPLLERVIKESMRVLSPVVSNGRLVTEETELGGFVLPRWSEVSFSPYVTHHMPELYEEPERFDPDRWLTINPGPYEYVPFGGGARLCIGASFAMMEISITLAMILQRFRLEMRPDATIDRVVTATMAPKPGMPLIVRKQDREHARSRHPVRGQIHEMVQLER